ncbi:unnamed protein product, partial [marine sediment metagenome]
IKNNLSVGIYRDRKKYTGNRKRLMPGKLMTMINRHFDFKF